MIVFRAAKMTKDAFFDMPLKELSKKVTNPDVANFVIQEDVTAVDDAKKVSNENLILDFQMEN